MTKVESIKQRRERELEATAWYFERTGRHIRNRAHLNKIMKDHALAKAIDIVLAKQDTESGQ